MCKAMTPGLPFPIPAGDLDLLAVGEAVVDFISQERVTHLAEAATFRRFQGGSPANLAANVARLGGRAALIAKVGDDPFGHFIRAELEAVGVETATVITDPTVHTSLVFVTRSAETPEFVALRDGDFRLTPAEIDAALIRQARIVHLTAWPLSREPARSAARRAVQIAREAGRLVSFDPNYSPHLWPDRAEAQAVMAEFLRHAALLKPSLDDARRLFGETITPTEAVCRFHAMGAALVVLTLGAEGTLISDGRAVHHLPARPVRVRDATGAGDAFWAGFLVALLDGHPPEVCAQAGRDLAELKLRTLGPLPRRLASYRRAV